MSATGPRPVTRSPGASPTGPRRQHLMAGIPQLAHRPTQPSAMRQVMLHRGVSLLVRVPRITLASSRGDSRAPFLQPIPVPYAQRPATGIPQLPDHIRRAVPVPLVQPHGTFTLLSRIPRHNDGSSPPKESNISSPPRTADTNLPKHTYARRRLCICGDKRISPARTASGTCPPRSFPGTRR